MQEQLQRLAALSLVDVELDELREELGDLPYEVEELEEELKQKEAQLAEIEKQKKELLQFRADARISLEEMKAREKKLAEQQFQARNNKEFDAITKELETLQKERTRIESELGTNQLSEENLERTLESHRSAAADARERLESKREELKLLSSDQNEELTQLSTRREMLVKDIKKEFLAHYTRIRELHINPTVAIHKESCSGCYNFVTPQTLVEMRKYLRIHYCENCGRMLHPEEMEIPEQILA